ncbi:MAG: outer membrane protein OmpA-like peptidoglycan-associated protein [Flammeovirgaceae bacterium]|jgi:outer membrane protein OmpA-like peptidoglycan-associated protein
MKHLLLTIILFLFSFKALGQDEEPHRRRELGNFLSMRAGAKIIACSGTDSTDWMIHNLIDDTKDGEGSWRVKIIDKKKKTTVFPQWFVIELPIVETISSMLFATDHLTGKYACVKNLTIEFSTESPTKGYEKVAFEVIQHNKATVYVSLPTSDVRWIRVTAKSNWGNPYFLEMGRVYGYNDVAMDNYAAMLEDNKELQLRNIYFEKDNTIIRQESLPVIEMLAYILRSNPDWHIAIEGHTDGDGTHNHNISLSMRRAEAVLDGLVMAGINRQRLSAVGKGATEKLIKEITEDDKARNRRVVIALTRSDQQE